MSEGPEGHTTSEGLRVRRQDEVVVWQETPEVKLPGFKFCFTLTAAERWASSLPFLIFCSLIYKMEMVTKPAGVLVGTK